MANSNYEDKIIDAIETIVQNAVQKAGYDKTIQCQIIECIDPTIGKYKVRYQDSSFIAYSGSSDITYLTGSDVYVLIPNNDMTRDKTILGTTKKLGVNYIGTVVDEESLYEAVGNNCIHSSNSYEFCSYKNEVKLLYDKAQDINELNLNLTSVETYIKNSSSILCGGEFQTKLPTEQKFKGNFGIIFELTFYDNKTNDSVTRNYVIDVNHMLGSPYEQINWTRQYGIFELDTANFRYINKIYLFVNDFPHQQDGKPVDIFMRNLEFCGMKVSDANELDSYGLTIITPQGTYFTEDDAESASRKLQGQVRVKRQNVNNDSQSIKYYWFVENVGVTIDSPLYCNYGGQGWECKNLKNAVGTDKSGNTVYEWVPGKWEYVVTKAQSQAKETKYKCVAVYNDIVLTKEVIIINYASNWNITIESDGGVQFYYDIGNPSLVCKINNVINSSANFTYVWAEIDNANNFYSLGETTAENQEYNNAVAAYNNLMSSIKAETAMPAASKQKLDEYLTIIKKYDKIMRVEKMYLHHLQINEITNFSTYKCSVYKDGVFLGSSSIVIKNTLDAEDAYSLIINNGNQVFKYDEMGISPVHTSLDIPITLTPLSFTVYDNLGNPIDEEILKTCDIKWIVPASNTMLEIPAEYGTPIKDLTNNTLIYENHYTVFSYLINDKYDITKTNNNIQLNINYKGMNLVTKTNFTFIKEGEPGTNGTEFAVRIVPNVPNNEIAPVYPMLINGKPNWNIKNNQSNKWFVLQMWHNGNMIYNGYGGQPSSTTEGKTISLKWSILANKYNTSVSDSSDITIQDAATGSFTYKSYSAGMPANIIKCTVSYEGVKYYATLPLITAKTISNYKIALKDNTGFRYATYSADGRRPQYDNSNPFELLVTKNINGYWEDVSKLTKTEAVAYKWTTKGRIYDPVTKIWIVNKNYLIKENKTVDKNQIWYKPIDTYTDECVNIGLECAVTHSGTTVANIHIPIHFLLNRYGQAALNDWDGNSISVDKNGSGVILAPQAGAGHKENDNSFTGVLIGDVKESGKNAAETGLFGYNYGTRTIFLNSKDGSALFGKNGAGQLIIDPSQKKALLYSNNYWKTYAVDGKPVSYLDSNKNNAGMLIDLSTPLIEFGNGNFKVDSNGHLTAKGGGSIANWQISNNSLSSSKGGGTIVINSDGSIQGTNGTNTWAIYSNGSAVFNKATVTGNVTAIEGKIGNWVISQGAISAGKVKLDNAGNIKQTEGKWAINSDGSSKFGNLSINNDGSIIANGGTFNKVTVNGNITASEGKIGNWIISNGSLSLGKVILDSAGNIKQTEGKWAINSNGSAKFGKLSIDTDGSLTATGGKFTDVTVSGNVTAIEGNIGGFEILSNKMRSTNKLVGISSSTYPNDPAFWAGVGDPWETTDWGTKIPFYVSNQGFLHASNAEITGKINAGSGKIGGWTISSDRIASFTTDNKYAVGIISGGGNSTDATFHVWSEDLQRNTFYITKGGKLYAENAEIKGKITATSGSFTGKIIADDGKIGGWSINDYKIYWQNSSGTRGVCMQIPDYTWSAGNKTKWVFAAGTFDGTYSNAEFRVDRDGNLYANAGQIGDWEIKDGALIGHGGLFDIWLTPYGVEQKSNNETVAARSWPDIIFNINPNE